MPLQFATNTPDPPAPPPPPTDTYHQLQAQKFLDGFAGLRAGMDPLTLPHPTTLNFVKGYRAVPVAFNDDVIFQTAQTTDLQALNRLDIADCRNRQQFNQGWSPVLDEVDKFATALRFQLGLNHATVSASTLQTYAGAKALARDPGSTHVRVSLKYMARHLKTRGLRKLANQPPQPPPAPATVPGFEGFPVTGKESTMNH
jgi:hypothetical protein